MHGDAHIGGNIGYRRVDEIAIKLCELLWIVAVTRLRLAIIRVAQHRDKDLVELEVAAAGIGKGAHRLAISGAEVGEEVIEIGVDAGAHRLTPDPAVERGRGGNGDLRHLPGMACEKLEMRDHGMTGEAELADNARPLSARAPSGKRNALVHHVAFDAVQAPEKIELPPRAAELAVGDAAQADLLLLAGHVLDLAIFDGRKLCRGDLAFGALFARLLQGSRPQQASYVIGAKRRLASLHEVTP